MLLAIFTRFTWSDKPRIKILRLNGLGSQNVDEFQNTPNLYNERDISFTVGEEVNSHEYAVQMKLRHERMFYITFRILMKMSMQNL